MRLPQSKTQSTETLRSLRTPAISALDRLFRRRERRDTQRAQRAQRSVILAVILCSLVLLTACNSSEQPNTNTPVISGPPRTTFPMPPLNGVSIVNLGWEDGAGKRAVISEYKGKVLVLDFYATYCLPCRDSVPHLIGLQKKYEDQGLRVIGLHVGGPDDAREIRAFAQEFGIQYPLVVPDEDLVSLLLGDVDRIPQTFVFDRQNKLIERLVGFGPGSGEIIDRAVESALKIEAP